MAGLTEIILKPEDFRNNSGRLWLDPNARSISYFSIKKPVVINSNVLGQLKKISEENNNSNIRLCLHSSPSDTLHDMIILEYQDKKCRRPHKHLTKDETLQIFEGEMLALLFNEEGEVLSSTRLDAKDNFILRGERGIYHSYLPLSNSVLYREIKQGPFTDGDNILANWKYIPALREYVSFNLDCYNALCKTKCALSKIKDNK